MAGLVILGAAFGGLFWYLKKKRNQEIEEEHRRNAAVSAFINGSNPSDSSDGTISMTDSRLDPVMAQRRLSDGSIADNQDYSRKILRVRLTSWETSFAFEFVITNGEHQVTNA